MILERLKTVLQVDTCWILFANGFEYSVLVMMALYRLQI